MSAMHSEVSVLIILLLIASAVAMATKWVRLPYTLALVIVGLIISPMHFLPPVGIQPEVILLVFLPALLFEAAWNLKLEQLRANLFPILVLAVPGVCISAAVVGFVLHTGLGLSWNTALLFGGMISATDPVSVLALFRKFGLPRRLATIVEGESLFNDGTAVVVFRIVLGISVGASMQPSGQLVLSSVREFGVVVFGGMAVGAVIGLLASTLTAHFNDHLLEITLTTIAAYGSYLLAEGLTVSPVIAVLLAGLVIGNYGRRTGMSPGTQGAVNSFWEYAAFVANSLVFLLIGLEIHITALWQNLESVAWAVLAMQLARFVSVYGLIPVTNRFSAPIPFRWQHVFFWGGLRGALSVALVLSLPATLHDRSQLIVMIFGAVIFSLLAQGLTVNPLLRRLKFARLSPDLKEHELLQAKLLVTSAATSELDNWYGRGMLRERTYNELKTGSLQSQHELNQRLNKLEMEHTSLGERQLGHFLKRLVDVKKAKLAGLLQEGVISADSYDELSDQFDREAATIQTESLPVTPPPKADTPRE